MLSTSLLGLIFAKLSRPRPRAQTVMFSKHAVIAEQDGVLSLMFRVGDARKSQLLDITVSLYCIQFRTNSTGQEILVAQHELPISTEHGLDVGQKIYPFLLLPLTIVHVIDQRSPLYELGAQDLKLSRLELVAVLEGVVESTSMVTQARASYLAEEITWGQRFHPISVMRNIERGWRADFSSFDKTYRVRTPTLSAKKLRESKCKDDEKRKLQRNECQVWITPEDAELPPEKPEMHSSNNCKDL